MKRLNVNEQEMASRISEQFQKRPGDKGVALAWQAYLAALIEWGVLAADPYSRLMGISIAPGASERYNEEVLRWERRAVGHINGNIGYISGTIEHLYHGRKADRGYLSRWEMFLKHGFDPHEDLKRNAFGVLEFATNKPDLRHDFDLYLRARNEDANVLN